MKSLFTLSLLTLSLVTFSLSSTARANAVFISCNKIQNSADNARTPNTLLLAMRGQDIATVLVRVLNSRMRSLTATKLPVQDIPNFTSYAVQGFSSPMTVDNQILEGKVGVVRIGDLDFSCSL